MGSPDSEPERGSDEKQHSVTIKQPFAIGKYEVSFAEYDRFAKKTGRTPPRDNGWGRGDRPVSSSKFGWPPPITCRPRG
ncbi:SUMF1/EgtB/PvdO family nonheme iron enzyme [uncultured Lamprocystis sp.]|jgi:formylglycine-generating enzyme required for sulfatase activity|nr:SUMF1/EgtB/PvdO family nonheme iron enzyme [uncultured Lamprocystis sp.]